MARAVGIDIGTKNLKILELERYGSKYRITFFKNVEIQSGPTPEATQQLCTKVIKDAFEQYRLEQDNLVLALPSQDCLLREISVALKDDNHIRPMIRFEAEKYLAGYEIEQVVVDYRRIQELDENRTQLFLAAVPKIKVLEQRLKILDDCHLDPISTDLDVMGLVNVFRLTQEYREKDRVAVLDFGASSTKILVFNKGQLRHVRAMRLRSSGTMKDGSLSTSQRDIDLPRMEDLDLGIESKLFITVPGLDGPDGRLVLIKKDNSEEIALQKKNEDFFRRVIKELKRIMSSIHLDDPIQIFCITGGGAQTPGLRERIEQEFQIPTVILDFTQNFIQCPTDNREELMVSGPVALGMAMEFLDPNSQAMNFRQEEYSYTNRFELMKKPLAVLVTMLWLLCTLVAFYCYRQRIAYEKAHETLLDKARICYEQIYANHSFSGNKFNQISNFHGKLKDIIDSQESNSDQAQDALQQCLILFQQIKQVRNRFYITLQRFDIRQEEAILEGEIQDDSTSRDCLENAIKDVKQKLNTADNKISTVFSPNTNPSDQPLKYRYQLNVNFIQPEEE